MTALPPVTVVVGATTATAYAVEQVTITHGRQSVSDDVAPATCQLRFLRQSVTWTLSIGDQVTVTTTGGAPGNTRFIGNVTSVTVTDLFVDVVATSAALGLLARTRLTNYVVNRSGTTPRVGGALELALADATDGLPVAPAFTTVDTGYVNLMSDVDLGTTSGLDAMQSIASWDVYGLLSEQTDGGLIYDQYRTATSAAWTFPTSSVFRDWSVTRDLGSMGNIQSVVYNGDQSRTVRDSASVVTYGAFQQSRTMQCTDVADALSGANASLLAAGTPWPIITGIGFDLSSLANLTAQQTVLASQVSTVVDTTAAAAYVPGLPAKSVIEGWTEVITRHTWTIRYNLSDVEQTLRPETWAAVTPTLTWAAVSPSISWRDMITGSL